MRPKGNVVVRFAAVTVRPREVLCRYRHGLHAQAWFPKLRAETGRVNVDVVLENVKGWLIKGFLCSERHGHEDNDRKRVLRQQGLIVVVAVVVVVVMRRDATTTTTDFVFVKGQPNLGGADPNHDGTPFRTRRPALLRTNCISPCRLFLKKLSLSLVVGGLAWIRHWYLRAIVVSETYTCGVQCVALFTDLTTID